VNHLKKTNQTRKASTVLSLQPKHRESPPMQTKRYRKYLYMELKHLSWYGNSFLHFFWS